MKRLCEYSKELFTKGYSCSESIIRAAYELGYYKTDNINEINKISSAFSGGMSSGCLCGAVAGSQIVLGLIFGREDIDQPKSYRYVSKKFIDLFKAKRKSTCCRALSAKLDFDSPERRANCTEIVGEAAQVLDLLIKEHNELTEKAPSI